MARKKAKFAVSVKQRFIARSVFLALMFAAIAAPLQIYFDWLALFRHGNSAVAAAAYPLATNALLFYAVTLCVEAVVKHSASPSGIETNVLPLLSGVNVIVLIAAILLLGTRSAAVASTGLPAPDFLQIYFQPWVAFMALAVNIFIHGITLKHDLVRKY